MMRPPSRSIASHCISYPAITSSIVAPGARWSVPAPQLIAAPSGIAARLRRISSRLVGQSSPIPRCAVSMLSATPSPSDHRYWRYATVRSQSIAGVSHGSPSASGSETTCAAASATRLNGGRAAGNASGGRVVYGASPRSRVGNVSVGIAQNSSSGRSIQRRSRQLRSPASASCTPFAPASRLHGNVSVSPARCRRNSSHCARNPLG